MKSKQSIRFPSLTHPPQADEPFICFVMAAQDPYEVRVRYEPISGPRPARFRCDEHGDAFRELCRHAQAAANYMRSSK